MKEAVAPSTPPVADARVRSFSSSESLRTRVAGVFLFWPLLTRLNFPELVQQAGYPGSKMVPALSALLSLLVLKLVDKERRSHISDFNFDEALGLFAGLNVLPKSTFATDYADEIRVCFDKRSHNPILRQAALDAEATPIPWAGSKRLRFSYAGASP